MDWITQPETWIAFLTLVALELILGVDNVIFISILSGKLPQEQQGKARRTGIMLAVVTRILLLVSLRWIIGLDQPLFTVFHLDVSGRDLILFAGGLFLIAKSTHEIHEKLEGVEGQASAKVQGAFWSVIIQIMLLDIVFSLDSVITAVGMVDELAIMIAAVVIAAIVMVFTSGPLGNFVEPQLAERSRMVFPATGVFVRFIHQLRDRISTIAGHLRRLAGSDASEKPLKI